MAPKKAKGLSRSQKRQERALCPHCNKFMHRNSVRRHVSVYGIPHALSQSIKLPWNIPKDGLRILYSDEEDNTHLHGGHDNSEPGVSSSPSEANGEEEWAGINEADDLRSGTEEMENEGRMSWDGLDGMGDDDVGGGTGPTAHLDSESQLEMTEHVDLLLNAASSASESSESEGEWDPDWESASDSTEASAEDEETEWPLDYGISPLLPAPMQAGHNYELEVARAVRRNGVPEGSALYAAVRAYHYQLKNNLGSNSFGELKTEFPELQIPSLKVLRRLMRELSGLEPKFTDCCPNSCICFTADLSSLTVCPTCGNDRYLSDGSPANQLLHLPLVPQLRARYAGLSSAREMRYRAENQDEHILDPAEPIADIYDAELYRSLRESHPVIDGKPLPHRFFDDPRDVLLVGLTDGFQLFRRGKHTAWPVIYINANLSPLERYKDENIIIVGLIPGPSKPKNFNSFMHVFAEELMQGSVGVSAYDALRDEMFVLRFYAPFGGGDMPAVAAAWLNSKGHNAKHPCRACDIEGIRIIGGGSPGRKENKTHYIPVQRPSNYPPPSVTVTVTNLPLRNHKKYLKQAREVDLAPSLTESRRLATLYGINGIPIASHIPGVRFPESFPHELMHLLENQLSNMVDFISGNFKKLDAGSEDYILPKTVWEEIGVATVEANATIPSAFGRKIKNVATERHFYTAEAYLVWSTLYAPILLRDRFSKPKYYEFFLRTVSITERCMAFMTTSQERNQLRKDIQQWYLEYERIFYQYDMSRLSACLLTVHAWLHVVDDMEKAGPLPCFWCWCMERICGRLSRAITSRKHPYASLNRRIVELQTFRAIVNKFDLRSRPPFARRSQSTGPSFDHDAYDDYTLLAPRKFLRMKDPGLADLRRRIAVFLATQLDLPVRVLENELPPVIEQWARVQMHDGDLIRTHCGYSRPRRDARDATYVQYELLVDIFRHRPQAKPTFQRRTFFGRLERVLVCKLPHAAHLKSGQDIYILADILPCKTTMDRYGFFEYQTFAAREVVNLDALRAVVGRIRDRGKWVIVRRKGGIEHAQYHSEEDAFV